MNVVDSSGWLEFFGDGENADQFAPAIIDTTQLVVPAITLYEVFKRILQQRDEATALQAVTQMMQGDVADLDASLALDAAKLSLDLGLPMADSIILATAQAHNATLWTQDSDFADMPNVRFFPKPA